MHLAILLPIMEAVLQLGFPVCKDIHSIILLMIIIIMKIIIVIIKFIIIGNLLSIPIVNIGLCKLQRPVTAQWYRGYFFYCLELIK